MGFFDKVKKITTANNTLDKKIISKIPFEYMHHEWQTVAQ